MLHVAPGADRVHWVLVEARRDRRDALGQDLQRLAMLAEAARQQSIR